MAEQRARLALQAMFVADALSMPVHWYYRPRDIKQQFGTVTTFHDAPAKHPSSIMNLHSTSTGGRRQYGASKKEPQPVVGRVILKNKEQLWLTPNTHYHHGMKAGENTLNAQCARVLLRTMAKDYQYDANKFLQNYVDFMTHDPPLHPDTYAESYHRSFFANYDLGKPLEECGEESHDTPSIGGLVTAAPLAIFSLLSVTGGPKNIAARTASKKVLRKHVSLTHPDDSLLGVSDMMVDLIADLLARDAGEDAGPLIAKAGKRIGVDLAKLVATARHDSDVVGDRYSTACYISGSWPNVLYLAYKYRDDPMAALVANTNLGGENCHRGSVLGVIVALASNDNAQLPLYEKLVEHDNIDREITEFLRAAHLNATTEKPITV